MTTYIIQIWNIKKTKTLSNLNCLGYFFGFDGANPNFDSYGKEYKTIGAAKRIVKRIKQNNNPYWILRAKIRKVVNGVIGELVAE